jgi:phytoene dehydrogenase-like protein
MKPHTDFDVVIIGAGHNGLTCAGYLARAGLSVKVVERRHIVGGAAVTEEFYPGFRNSMCSYTVSLLSPKVIADLELHKFGLTITDRASTGLIIGEDDDYLFMGDDLNKALELIAKTHPQDAENFVHFEEVLDAIADVLRDAALETPPNIGGNLMDLFRAGKLGLRINKLTPYLQTHCIKLFTMSIADYLALWFEHPILTGELCYIAMVGNMQSIYAPGSAYVLLHHAFGEVNGTKGAWGHAIGGMGAITQAMAKSAQAHGADIEVSAGVKEVIVENGCARGIILENGKTITARAVVANTNPKLLFQKLIGKQHLSSDFSDQINHYRCVSGSFRMNVALKEVPKFKCLEGKGNPEDFLRGSTSITPSKDYLEKAYHDAMTFGWSKNPVIELFVPSIYDDSLAPAGKHVASLFCQHFNPQLPNGKTWDDVKDEVVNLIIDTVTHYAPNFREAIEGYVALSPLDLEREFGLVGGDIFHGCLHLDQIFAMRPVAQYADYRMPLKNLYLCGSGAHPGGGVSGFPGHNAAREILKDFKGGLLGGKHLA